MCIATINGGRDHAKDTCTEPFSFNVATLGLKQVFDLLGYSLGYCIVGTFGRVNI